MSLLNWGVILIDYDNGSHAVVLMEEQHEEGKGRFIVYFVCGFGCKTRKFLPFKRIQLGTRRQFVMAAKLSCDQQPDLPIGFFPRVGFYILKG